MSEPVNAVSTDDDAPLRAFVERHRRLFVLTGAGCSTGSGIPDYRDLEGGWKRSPPITFQAFMTQASTRQRYWARSLIGWPGFVGTRSNPSHHALAALERQGRLELLLTQNVDGLHQAAGTRAVVDLHGRLDTVRCMGCQRRSPREALQQRLATVNPGWAGRRAGIAPDGDADLEGVDFDTFVVPACERCSGTLKPDVVYFGENVPRERVELAFAHLARADAVLVVGSSLMVRSGFRFVEAAARAGLPVVALNVGVTRADALLTLKIERDCAAALAFLLAAGAPR